jgi:hypothetical protein
VALGTVIDSLAREPGQLLSLGRVAYDAYLAFRALSRGRDSLGPRFASLVCPTVVAGGARLGSASGARVGVVQPA